MTIVARIKRAGWTSAELARRMGKTKSTMSGILNNNPTYSFLKEVADIMGVSVAYLVGDEPEPPYYFIHGDEMRRFNTIEDMKAYIDEKAAQNEKE